MITLHKKENSGPAEEFHSRLNDLVIRFNVEQIPMDSPDEFYIEESGKVIRKNEDIEAWFHQLESELKWQRSLSGDGCYIDPNTGNTC